MAQASRERLARTIAAMAHGKTLFAVSPVLGIVDRERREAVYRLVANEFEDFEQTVAHLLTGPMALRNPARPTRGRSFAAAPTGNARQVSGNEPYDPA